MTIQIQWKDEFSVGFDPIDAQHKSLIKIINDIYTVLETGQITRDRVNHFLDMLVLYTETHFEYEEKIMKFAGYEDTEAHKYMHKEMLLRTRGLALAMDVEPEEHMRRLLRVLVDWLINHIILQDSQYAAALKNLAI